MCRNDVLIEGEVEWLIHKISRLSKHVDIFFAKMQELCKISPDFAKLSKRDRQRLLKECAKRHNIGISKILGLFAKPNPDELFPVMSFLMVDTDKWLARCVPAKPKTASDASTYLAETSCVFNSDAPCKRTEEAMSRNHLVCYERILEIIKLNMSEDEDIWGIFVDDQTAHALDAGKHEFARCANRMAGYTDGYLLAWLTKARPCAEHDKYIVQFIREGHLPCDTYKHCYGLGIPPSTWRPDFYRELGISNETINIWNSATTLAELDNIRRAGTLRANGWYFAIKEICGMPRPDGAYNVEWGPHLHTGICVASAVWDPRDETYNDLMFFLIGPDAARYR